MNEPEVIHGVGSMHGSDLPTDTLGDDGASYLSLRKRRGHYVDEEGFEHDIIEEVNE